MHFRETPLLGAFVIEAQQFVDERGSFYRSFCKAEFVAAGLAGSFPQSNVSLNKSKGTLRGMHFQAPPHGEVKLVRCLKGAILDMIVDLRPNSDTYLQSYCVELSDENQQALYIPADFAHGFQTLCDDTTVYYHMGSMFVPGAGRGFRWNDPLFNLRWPLPVTSISEKDAEYENFDPDDQFHS